MNPAFYESVKRQELLQYQARRWLGTPFVPHAKVQNAGVDCVNLCAAIYIGTGFLSSFDPPKYTMDGGKHNCDSQLEQWIESSGRFLKLDETGTDRFQTGDLLTFKIGRSAHHAGLIVEGQHFIHCLFGRKVTMGTLLDGTFKRILHAAYRPLEVAA